MSCGNGWGSRDQTIGCARDFERAIVSRSERPHAGTVPRQAFGWGPLVSKDDWFRNTTWDTEIETQFQEKLRRARDKTQRLRIQAQCLAESHPRVALTLLDQYFSIGDRQFDRSSAYVTKAQALRALGDVHGALSSYEMALAEERQRPSLQTSAYLDFARLVLMTQNIDLYPRALELLEAYHDRPVWPVERYHANGARALLLQHFGQTQDARDAAKSAIAAASEVNSEFRYHQSLGLAENTEDDFSKRVAELAT